MARGFSEWLDAAYAHKQKLDQAISNGNEKDIIYYRGKYIYDLKQAAKILPNGVVPSNVTGQAQARRVGHEIRFQLAEHQTQVETSIKNNKKSKNKVSISKEIGLKIRRLSTRVSQYNFATKAATKKNLKGKIISDSLGLAGTAFIKTPIVAASKVISKVGPLAITVALLPAQIFNSLLSATIDISNGKSSKDVTTDYYSDTFVHQISKPLKDGVRNIFDNISRTVAGI